jgi:hypothetical protein
MDDAFEKFYNVTGYDIKSYFQKFVDFCANDYPLIVDYYSNGGEMDKDSFLRLVELVRESETIEPLFILHENTLDDISMWGILDNFTETQTKLSTIKSSARWLRSSSLDRNNTLQMEKTLRTGERFEDVSRQLNSTNPEDDWMNITIPQYIEETDYSFSDGGNKFYINLKNAGNNYLDTVVDVLVGDNILGRDIDVNFVFENDDLKIVIGDDAIRQALDTILSSQKGAIPEFKDYGITNEFIGTTVNAIQYPSIFKDIMNMFQRDSRWDSVELIDVKREEDVVFLSLQCKTVTKKDYLVNVPI